MRVSVVADRGRLLPDSIAASGAATVAKGPAGGAFGSEPVALSRVKPEIAIKSRFDPGLNLLFAMVAEWTGAFTSGTLGLKLVATYLTSPSGVAKWWLTHSCSLTTEYRVNAGGAAGVDSVGHGSNRQAESARGAGVKCSTAECIVPIPGMMGSRLMSPWASEEASMALSPDQATSKTHFLDDDESHQFFDREARRLMHMSGEEFLRRYDAGEFEAEMDGPRHRQLVQMVMLIPFGR
jgi:hypothetical protein